MDEKMEPILAVVLENGGTVHLTPSEIAELNEKGWKLTPEEEKEVEEMDLMQWFMDGMPDDD